MKRFPVDNISPGRWKRICPPVEDDSDSSNSSDSSVGDFFRSLYTFRDYRPTCTQCRLPNLVCRCNTRRTSSQAASTTAGRHVPDGHDGINSPIALLTESEPEEDRSPTNNGTGSSSAPNSGGAGPSRRSSLISPSPFRSSEGSSGSTVINFRASTTIERATPAVHSHRMSTLPLESNLPPSNRRRLNMLMEDIEPLLSTLRTSLADNSSLPTTQSIQPETVSSAPNPVKLDGDDVKVEDKTELDVFHSKLVGLIECPVCLEPIAPPVHQCRRGHLVCAKCKSQLHQCPTCRDKMSDMRNWAVERLAEQLKYPCKNSSSGCPVTAFLTDRTVHESLCPFRHYTCLFRTCSWTGFQPEMLPHLRTAHPLRFLEGSRQQIDVEMNSPTLFYTDWAISCYGRVFRFNVFQHIPNSMFYASAYLVGGTTERQTAQFTYTVTVNGSLGRRVSFTRQLHPETTRTSQLCHSEDCFSIRGDKMEHFAPAGGKLRLFVELEQME